MKCQLACPIVVCCNPSVAALPQSTKVFQISEILFSHLLAKHFPCPDVGAEVEDPLVTSVTLQHIRTSEADEDCDDHDGDLDTDRGDDGGPGYMHLHGLF